MLQATVRAYERQLDDLAGLEALKQRQRDFAESIASWTGFAEPPPYSILLVDNLRDPSAPSPPASRPPRPPARYLEKLEADTRQLLEQSDSRLRSLNEQFESATDPERRRA